MLPYSNDSTSRHAAYSMKPFAKGQAKIIIECLVKLRNRGGTTQELETILGISGNSLRPRLIQLEKKGMVFRNGLTRPTESGCLALVWFAASAVLEYFANFKEVEDATQTDQQIIQKS